MVHVDLVRGRISSLSVEEFSVSQEDVPYEEDILKNPFSLKAWGRYLDHKKHAPCKMRNMLYERAVQELPGSYKLWKKYLDERRSQVRHRCVLNAVAEELNNAYERALIFLHKMPVIWLDYCQFLVEQKKITQTRHAFDRALRSLPITQHQRVWDIYVAWVKSSSVPETVVRVFRRYLKFRPDEIEEYIEYLIRIGKFDEAAQRIVQLLDKPEYISRKNKSKEEWWLELASLVGKYPEHMKLQNTEKIMRAGLEQCQKHHGKLWSCLADYYIRQGLFEKARDIFEDGIQASMKIRDFSQIFNAYAQFEESVIGALMDQIQLKEAEHEIINEENQLDLDLRLARLESLMDRRPFLVNDVLLRQNPHNIHEWFKRIRLHKDHRDRVIETYKKALSVVDPKKAHGRTSLLWTQFAKYYEGLKDPRNAREVFERAVRVQLKNVEELATIWLEYAELEIRSRNYQKAREILIRATANPKKSSGSDEALDSIQFQLQRFLPLWALYADLEESLGTVDTVRSVYDRTIDLRIATPQIILNYANLLLDHQLHEGAFKVYERGVGLFRYPVAFEIWNVYLAKFVKHYGGKKLERARDLFEQALIDVPTQFAKLIFLMYAKFEEDFGMTKNAIKIYDRATNTVASDDRWDVYTLYIQRVADFYGVTATRDVYERAIEALPDIQSKDLCVRYAELERKLGEIDRARAIYGHASQFCDPRIIPSFWKTWQEFEIKHGNEDTFREMLRIKRSVQAKYNTQVQFLSAQLNASQNGELSAITAASQAPETATAPMVPLNDMQALESQMLSQEATRHQSTGGGAAIRFVSSDLLNPPKLASSTVRANPDEILLDASGSDIDDDELTSTEDIEIEEQHIPGSVFGSIPSQIEHSD